MRQITVCFAITLAVIGVCMMSLLSPVKAADFSAPSPSSVERLLSQPQLQERRFMGEQFNDLGAVREFYARRGHAPVWTRDRLEDLRFAFNAAQAAGIDPSAYHLDALGREYTHDNILAIELLATDAWLSLAEALAGPMGQYPDYMSYALGQDRLYEALAELIAFRSAP